MASRYRCPWLHAALHLLLLHWGGAVQSFLKEPQDLQPITDQTAILECVVDDLVSEVIWTKGGFGLVEMEQYPRYTLVGDKNKGEYSLMISNVNLDDDDLYECQVFFTSTTLGIRSRQAKVTVLVPCTKLDVLDSHPVMGSAREVIVDVVADMPYNLTCTAYNSRPAGNLTWYEDGTPVLGSSNITYYSVSTGANKLDNSTAMLTITPKRGDTSAYKCEVVNATLRGNNMARWIQLNVQYAPVVTIDTYPLHMVIEGATITFTCTASGNPNIISWSWFLESELIPGETRSVYVLQAVSHTHNKKTVTCQAANKVGNSSQSHTLDVNYRPRWKSAPKHVAVDLGDEAILRCEVDSNPDAEVLWQRADKLIKNSKTLIIPQVAPDDLGAYTCIAQVHCCGFPKVEQDIQVLQKGRPHILSPGEQSAKFGSKGLVECMMQSVPQPKTVVWRKGGKVLNLQEHQRYQVREETLPDGRLSVIEIRSVQDDDFDEYNCSIDNGYGNDSILITLEKQDVVPLAYILAGVLIGVLLILIIGVLVFVYHRRKKSSLTEGSENSDNSTMKRTTDDLTSEYKPAPYVDTWRPEFDQKYYRNSADYDELRYPTQEWNANVYDPDLPDAYNYGYERDPRRDYGTYPGTTALPPRTFDPRYDGDFIPPRPAEYGTYGRTSSRHNYPPLAPLPPAVPESKFSTNV